MYYIMIYILYIDYYFIYDYYYSHKNYSHIISDKFKYVWNVSYALISYGRESDIFTMYLIDKLTIRQYIFFFYCVKNVDIFANSSACPPLMPSPGALLWCPPLMPSPDTLPWCPPPHALPWYPPLIPFPDALLRMPSSGALLWCPPLMPSPNQSRLSKQWGDFLRIYFPITVRNKGKFPRHEGNLGPVPPKSYVRVGSSISFYIFYLGSNIFFSKVCPKYPAVYIRTILRYFFRLVEKWIGSYDVMILNWNNRLGV